MGFLDSIEKLINEHGSATILKERIELANDKYSALEDKVAILQQENAILKEHNRKLKSQLNEATHEVNRLKEIINSLQENKGTKEYDKVTQQILKMFFDDGGELSVNEFALAMSMNISTIQYHFDLLREGKLITQSKSAMRSEWLGVDKPAMYRLTTDGRKYVIENKIT